MRANHNTEPRRRGDLAVGMPRLVLNAALNTRKRLRGRNAVTVTP